MKLRRGKQLLTPWPRHRNLHSHECEALFQSPLPGNVWPEQARCSQHQTQSSETYPPGPRRTCVCKRVKPRGGGGGGGKKIHKDAMCGRCKHLLRTCEQGQHPRVPAQSTSKPRSPASTTCWQQAQRGRGQGINTFKNGRGNFFHGPCGYQTPYKFYRKICMFYLGPQIHDKNLHV